MSFPIALVVPVAVEDGVDVGALVVAVLCELQMTHKDAWITCGYGDGAQWHRALKGEAPLDLWKLRRLPIAFWQRFLPKLASALIQEFFADLALPYRQARADIKEFEDRKQRSA